MTGVPKNLTRHEGRIPRRDRERLLGQRACAVWLTGLPSSGKSTIARALEERLFAHGNLAYVLDGDNFRQGLNADLGFSPADRAENIRRLSEVAVLFLDAGLILIAAFISPFRADRDDARARVGPSRFLEIFVDTPAAVCEARDPKGLWARARRGELAEFTGVSSPYEPPTAPALAIAGATTPAEVAADRILVLLQESGFLNGTETPSR